MRAHYQTGLTNRAAWKPFSIGESIGGRILLSPNHTQVSNEFIEKYMGVLSGSSVKVFLAICRKTIGWHKDTDAISYSQIKKMSGLGSDHTVKKAIDELVSLYLIGVEKSDGLSSRYTLIYATAADNEEVSAKNAVVTSTKSADTKETSSKETNQKKSGVHEEDTKTANSLIDYLNTKTGKSYRHTDKNRTHILARLRDGFTHDDCKRVVDTKSAEWKGGDMDKYLRCSTLFAGKFEDYLNQKPPNGDGMDKYKKQADGSYAYTGLI